MRTSRLATDPDQRDARLAALERARYNVMNLDSDDIPFDLFSDVRYARHRFPFADPPAVSDEREPDLGKLAARVYGEARYVAVTRGRAAEHALWKTLALAPGAILTQGLFRSTEALLKLLGHRTEPGPTLPRDGLPTGDLDPGWVSRRLADGDVVAVVLETSSNSHTGRPLAVDSVRAMRALCTAHRVPLLIDATRALANAHALGGDVLPTVQEMLALADAFWMSCTKECLVPHGGLVGVRSRELHGRAYDYAFEEGTLLEPLAAQVALARGLTYLAEHAARVMADRAALLGVLADALRRRGCEVIEPLGGHAVFVAVDDALLVGDPLRLRRLEALLYLRSGVRSNFARYPTRDRTLMRLTWPIGYHDAADLEHVAAAVRDLFDHAAESPRLVEAPLDDALPATTRYYARA